MQFGIGDQHTLRLENCEMFGREGNKRERKGSGTTWGEIECPREKTFPDMFESNLSGRNSGELTTRAEVCRQQEQRGTFYYISRKLFFFFLLPAQHFFFLVHPTSFFRKKHNNGRKPCPILFVYLKKKNTKNQTFDRGFKEPGYHAINSGVKIGRVYFVV